MKLRTTAVRLALGTAALTGALLATAVPANASVLKDVSSGSGSCPANWVCLWSDNNFVRGNPKGGTDYGAVGSDENTADMGKIVFESKLWRWKGMQDEASSVVNNTGSAICFYEHNNYGGLEFRVGPHEKWASVPGWINDRISSFKYC
ncbi:hypothetical protein GCM10020229_04050 [Kitasatospora albolonga]|uniref:peptidase inhibitor family I36 protein n=1 Tax=Kitasatospora albolonga TaxID=68173 RepID=UPI0031F05C05